MLDARWFARRISFLSLLVVLLGLPAGVAAASDPPGPGGEAQVVASDPVVPVLTIPAREAPPFVPPSGPDRPVNPRQNFNVNFDPSVADSVIGKPDPLLPLQLAAPPAAPDAFATPLFNFDGQGYTFVNPPDTVGDVGTNHYIQMINGGGTAVAIYDKATGALLIQFALTSLGGCATGGGDPVVLYDHLAGRWLLSEFGAGNSLCVFVSQTPDPLGAYFSYQFVTPSFPDYPKYGVWPDAYYVTTNESSPAQYAFDRAAMLAGAPATSQRFTAPSFTGFGFQALTPADLDGSTPPPAGSPGLFLRHRDTEVHGPAGFPGNDQLEIWAFHVDFVTPANSTFATLATLDTAEFDSTLCGLVSFSCMAMPGVAQGAGNSLDPLREVVMHRLAYRNFGTHETLVGNFVTDIDGNNTGGVRWFELRKIDLGPWTLFQEGTYAPTAADNRWIGAIAMDGAGNIALGFNVSSGSVFPSLRYAGRLAGDPLGTLPQGEHLLVAGTGTNGSNRWGDYAAMSVDPVDDCTFWFTGEWNATPQWSTRIGAFRFDACGPVADLSISKTDGTVTAVPGASTVYTIQAANAGPLAAPVAQVTDTFPAACTSVTWTCVGAGGGVCPAANGSGNLNATVNLPVGGSVTFAATCAISSTATGTLTNTAAVAPGPDIVDPNPANDTATDIDTLVPTADVAVTKSDGTATAVPGTNTVYAIVASNAGPSAAPAANVTDTFPAACTSVTWTCAGAGGGTCPANGSGNLNATVNLPAGGSVTFMATCAISPAATGNLVNTANVAAGAGVTDPNGANNSATDTDTLVPTADVSVAKSVDPTAVDNGDPVTYTLVVANAGPSDAPGVTVTDLFPIQCQADLAWTCTPAGGATCTPAGVGDIADVVNLPVGSSVTYVATCSAYSPEDAEVENTATAQVPAGILDPDPGNSSSTATLAINAFAIQEIPTLGRTGLAVLLLLLGFAGFLLLRRTH